MATEVALEKTDTRELTDKKVLTDETEHRETEVLGEFLDKQVFQGLRRVDLTLGRVSPAR